MEWKSKKGCGNVLRSWVLSHNGVNICEIRMFIKKEYILPCELFPRDSAGMAQKIYNLIAAKSKCEKWVYEFSKSILKNGSK